MPTSSSPLSPGAPGHEMHISPRVQAVLSVERVSLAVRYAAYVLLAGYILVTGQSEAVGSLALITLGAIVHNTFVHWVFSTRKYEYFFSPLNVCLYLGKLSILIWVTGGGASQAALLYPAIMLGYCIYAPRFRSTFRITLVVCLAYSLTLLSYWAVKGIEIQESPIAVHFTAIILAGWLTGMLGRITRSIEVDAHTRAAALASSEATLRAILDSTPSPIIVYEESEFISDVNERACEFLGLPRERLIGRRFRSYLFDDGTLPNKLASLRTRGEYFGEALVISEDGAERSVNLVARSFMRDKHRLYVVLMHDITEQKDLQEAQRLTRVQLEQANRELQRVHDLRSAFFATISQRLRSPLSAIQGHLEMLLGGESGPLTPEQRRSLQSARRSAERVFGLLDEVFEVEGVAPKKGDSKAGPPAASPAQTK